MLCLIRLFVYFCSLGVNICKIINKLKEITEERYFGEELFSDADCFQNANSLFF